MQNEASSPIPFRRHLHKESSQRAEYLERQVARKTWQPCSNRALPMHHPPYTKQASQPISRTVKILFSLSLVRFCGETGRSLEMVCEWMRRNGRTSGPHHGGLSSNRMSHGRRVRMSPFKSSSPAHLPRDPANQLHGQNHESRSKEDTRWVIIKRSRPSFFICPRSANRTCPAPSGICISATSRRCICPMSGRAPAQCSFTPPKKTAVRSTEATILRRRGERRQAS